MSVARWSRRHPSRGAFWRFNWLAHHQVIGALARARAHARGTLLDVGCGTMPFAAMFEGRVTRTIGLDLPASRFLGEDRPDVFARAEALPIRDATADTLLALAMTTYLPEPLVMLAEARRVLRPGGVLIVEFTQMAPLHDEPHDYFRFTRYGAAHLLDRAGFEVVETIPIGGLWSRVGLSLIAPLNRINRGPWRVITEVPVRLLYVVVQLGCAALDRLWRDPREVLAHLVVARRRETAAGTDPAAGFLTVFRTGC